ncbi:MAG: outer membrane protein assembly factor BamA [Pseudomonadota bacterium]
MSKLLNKLLYILACVFTLILVSAPIQAAEEFVIEDIRVEGLERISPGTVFNYLPMQVGDTFDDSRSAEAVRVLFKTGFFDDVRLERDGSILVFRFKERPAIGSISFTGNEDIDTDDLIQNLNQIGFAEGRVFVQAQLEQVENELRRQYFSMGKYAIRITTTVTELSNNRVGIDVDISEGVAAKIKTINIVGNTVFDEDDLLDQFKLSTPTMFSFFTKNDQYSKQKLSADLESLRSYYLDAGYLNFNIDSTQVSITPDKKDIYITINVTEGEQYLVTEVKLGGDLILPEADLFDLVLINSGELFSRKKVTESSRNLTERLGQEGYSFANVNSIPDINNEEKTVSLTFFVDPGKRIYVRRINFTGNTKTRDEVLRREMRQQERAWISTTQVERGRIRLQRTGYFKDVNVETPAVAGTSDQVDINYTVEEAPGGRLTAGLGFSPAQGVIFNLGVAQDNFLGSGKRISFDFNNSSVNTRYSLGYRDPYFTIDGISLGGDVFYREVDAFDANLARYETKEYGSTATFGLPISENNRINASINYTRTELDLESNSSQVLQDFVNNNGNEYDLLKLSLGFSYNTLNDRFLPNKGSRHAITGLISTPFIGESLEFYKVNYDVTWFRNIYKEFILNLSGNIGYGDSYGDTTELPFFENFYAGGPKTVRGFEENTLGPRDDRDRPIGGDTRVVANAEIILPIPFLTQFKKTVRVTGFFDAGNVYGPDEDLDLGELRYSSGIGAIWISPFGAVSASAAIPLNDDSDDDVQNFQFTFGTAF